MPSRCIPPRAFRLLHKVISTNELFACRRRSIGRQVQNGVAIRPICGSSAMPPVESVGRTTTLAGQRDFRQSDLVARIYIAVSQTGDPTGTYNVYTVETTNGAPCRLSLRGGLPRISFDQYGFCISSKSSIHFSESFVDASILAISKQSLASAAIAPTAFKFLIPF